MTVTTYISPLFFDKKIQDLNTVLASLTWISERYPLANIGISDGKTFPEVYQNDGSKLLHRIYPKGNALSFFTLNGDVISDEDNYDFSVPLSLYVWADLGKINKTATDIIIEVAKKLKSNSCNDLTIETEDVFNKFSDLTKLSNQNVLYPYTAFRIDFSCMLTICWNPRPGVPDTQKPTLVTAILTDAFTLELTYDENLNESKIPALADYIFNGSTGIGTWTIGATFIIT